MYMFSVHKAIISVNLFRRVRTICDFVQNKYYRCACVYVITGVYECGWSKEKAVKHIRILKKCIRTSRRNIIYNFTNDTPLYTNDGSKMCSSISKKDVLCFRHVGTKTIEHIAISRSVKLVSVSKQRSGLKVKVKYCL